MQACSSLQPGLNHCVCCCRKARGETRAWGAPKLQGQPRRGLQARQSSQRMSPALLVCVVLCHHALGLHSTGSDTQQMPRQPAKVLELCSHSSCWTLEPRPCALPVAACCNLQHLTGCAPWLA